MSRIGQTFQALRAGNRTGIITYVTVGFPTVKATLDLVPALADAGADMIELGVPFSDPLADGATIQRASQVAITNGVTLSTCLDVCRHLRERLPLVPLIFMGYYNPILVHGVDRFAKEASAAGADGVIVPDLPPEEADSLSIACAAQEIDLIFFLAPTSTDRRIEVVGKIAKGFVYCVSLTGVTGVRSDVAVDLPGFLARVRKYTNVSLAVGFGVSTPEHVRSIGSVADAVIVGSALIAEIERTEIDGAAEGSRVKHASSLVQRLSSAAARGPANG